MIPPGTILVPARACLPLATRCAMHDRGPRGGLIQMPKPSSRNSARQRYATLAGRDGRLVPRPTKHNGLLSLTSCTVGVSHCDVASMGPARASDRDLPAEGGLTLPVPR